MTEDLTTELARASAAMPPRPERHREVVQRADRARRFRLVGVAGATAAATAVVALVAAAIMTPTTTSPPTSASTAPDRPGEAVPFTRALAVPEGLRIEFAGADPTLPRSSHCRIAYSAETAPGTDGELRVTVVGRLDTTAMGQTDVICNDNAYPRFVVVPVERSPEVVIDGASGKRHRVESARP